MREDQAAVQDPWYTPGPNQNSTAGPNGVVILTYCANNGFTQSMGRTGVCWDNAAAETFFATLKNEMYHQQVFATRARARFAVAEYIEVFYNRRRPHSSIGYRTPARAWNEHHAAQDLSRAA